MVLQQPSESYRPAAPLPPLPPHLHFHLPSSCKAAHHWHPSPPNKQRSAQRRVLMHGEAVLVLQVLLVFCFAVFLESLLLNHTGCCPQTPQKGLLAIQLLQSSCCVRCTAPRRNVR
ncbi:Protein of unknown function [Pyronema omphalodes CBS 100304]|uniref:Uncharacterized protein n=1 Tax=Pyronema omphalodes (strain CBS 100304) TaxID=1076935 RepID=U4L170_PYROM|nr:Protein of unknown function [Pyronema omphalodes CBS 100304]